MKKKRGLNIHVHLSNRWLYFMVTLGILAIAGVGVWAYGTSSPSTFGHSSEEINVDNLLCNKITGHSCGYDADTTVGDGGTIFKNIRIYSIASACGSGYTFSSQCSTKVCGSTSIPQPYGGTVTTYYYYNCDGRCKSSYTSPYTCNNVFQGYILTYIPNK